MLKLGNRLHGDLVAFQLLVVTKECVRRKSAKYNANMKGASLLAGLWVRLPLNSLPCPAFCVWKCKPEGIEILGFAHATVPKN